MVRSTYSSYWAACSVLIAAVGLRVLLDPVLNDGFPLVTLVVSIGAAAWIGGWRVAAVVTLVGYVIAQYVSMAPLGGHEITSEQDLTTLVAYMLISATIVGFGRAWEMRVRSAERRFETVMLDRFQKVEAMQVGLANCRAAAAAAEVTKNEFVANIRHERRTPLNSIIGFTSLLSESSLDEEQRRQLDFANAAAPSPRPRLKKGST